MYPGNSSEHSPLSVQLSGSDYNITSVWMKNFDLGIGLQYVNEIFASGCYVISGFFGECVSRGGGGGGGR